MFVSRPAPVTANLLVLQKGSYYYLHWNHLFVGPLPEASDLCLIKTKEEESATNTFWPPNQVAKEENKVQDNSLGSCFQGVWKKVMLSLLAQLEFVVCEMPTYKIGP